MEIKDETAFDVNDFETTAAAMVFIRKKLVWPVAKTLHEACSVKKKLAIHVVKSSLHDLESHLHEFDDILELREYLMSVVFRLHGDKIDAQVEKWAYRRYYGTVYNMVYPCIGHPKIANQITVMVLNNVRPENEVEMGRKKRLNYFKWQVCKLVFQYIQDILKIDTNKLYYSRDWLFGETDEILPE